MPNNCQPIHTFFFANKARNSFKTELINFVICNDFSETFNLFFYVRRHTAYVYVGFKIILDININRFNALFSLETKR